MRFFDRFKKRVDEHAKQITTVQPVKQSLPEILKEEYKKNGKTDFKDANYYIVSKKATNEMLVKLLRGNTQHYQASAMKARIKDLFELKDSVAVEEFCDKIRKEYDSEHNPA